MRQRKVESTAVLQLSRSISQSRAYVTNCDLRVPIQHTPVEMGTIEWTRCYWCSHGVHRPYVLDGSGTRYVTGALIDALSGMGAPTGRLPSNVVNAFWSAGVPFCPPMAVLLVQNTLSLGGVTRKPKRRSSNVSSCHRSFWLCCRLGGCVRSWGFHLRP